MLCLLLFHIDYTIYANHVLIKLKKRCLTRDIELIIKYRVSWEVKVVQSCITNEYTTVSFLLYV